MSDPSVERAHWNASRDMAEDTELTPRAAQTKTSLTFPTSSSFTILCACTLQKMSEERWPLGTHRCYCPSHCHSKPRTYLASRIPRRRAAIDFKQDALQPQLEDSSTVNRVTQHFGDRSSRPLEKRHLGARCLYIFHPSTVSTRSTIFFPEQTDALIVVSC